MGKNIPSFDQKSMPTKSLSPDKLGLNNLKFKRGFFFQFSQNTHTTAKIFIIQKVDSRKKYITVSIHIIKIMTTNIAKYMEN